MLRLILIASLLAACGRAEPSTPDTSVVDWPADRDCDGLLWSGIAAASGWNVDLHAARGSNGLWYRRPISFGNCYPKESRSAISRDMFVGLAAGLLEQGDAAALDATLQYAQKHAGVMGAPWPAMASRVQWTGNIWAIFSRAAVSLGVARWQVAVDRTKLDLLPVGADFEYHLQLIELHTFFKATGFLTPELQSDARDLAAAFPMDALAQAIGCLGGADTDARAHALLDDPGYPSPDYVRGPARAFEIHKAYAAKVLADCTL